LATILGNRYARRMMLKHRRIQWADGTDAANDFSVIDERGKKIGRIFVTSNGGSNCSRALCAGPPGQLPGRRSVSESVRKH